MKYDPTDPRAQEDIERRVKRGATHLDELYDRWEDAIDLKTLSLDNSDLCILGQIGHHPEFSNGKDYFDMLPFIFPDAEGSVDEHGNSAREAVAVEHGLDVEGHTHYWEDEYAALTKEWAVVIKERMSSR